MAAQHNGKAVQTESTTTGGDTRLDAYRKYVADLLIRYATRNGSLDHPEAVRELMRITGRSLSTVKNWVTYKAYAPDLEALGRIVHHWKIPPSEIYPSNLGELLGIGAANELVSGVTTRRAAFDIRNAVMLFPFGPRDEDMSIKALSKYSDYPKSTIFVREDSGDMADVIRSGELMLIDSSVEQVTVNGMYYLRYNDPAGSGHSFVRMVVRHAGQQAVRIFCTNPLLGDNDETVQLVDDQLPDNMSVLGRVVAVLKQT